MSEARLHDEPVAAAILELKDGIELAIQRSFCSDDVDPPTRGTVNVVDAMESMKDAVSWIGNAITPQSVIPGRDTHGGYITSLTEAVMGVEQSLSAIAEAILELAQAVRDTK